MISCPFSLCGANFSQLCSRIVPLFMQIHRTIVASLFFDILSFFLDLVHFFFGRFVA